MSKTKTTIAISLMIFLFFIIIFFIFADFRIHNIFQFVKSIIFLSTAFYLIINKPISKARGIKFRNFEIGLGLLWMIISLGVFYLDIIEPNI